MPAVLLKGAEAAKKIAENLRAAAAFCEKRGRRPTLAVIRIGADAAAALYAKAIRRVMTELGCEVKALELAGDLSEKAALAEISKVSRSEEVTGAILLAPFPLHLDRARLEAALPPEKDVEGARPLSGAWPRIYPPTALAIAELAEAAGVPIRGRHAVVVGRSRIVGLPAAQLLLERDATVTICHSKTPDLAEHVRRADILVAAAGKPGLIRGDWIKPGAVVIDAGENDAGGRVVGDVDFDSASRTAGFITPVPGGVGPLTVYMLGRNLLSIASAGRI